MNDLVELERSKELLDLLGHMLNVRENEVINNVSENDVLRKDNLKNNELCFYRISQLSFDEDYPRREAFANVLGSLDKKAFNFVYILSGTKEGVELYIGIVKNSNLNKLVLDTKLSAVDYGKIVESVFEGNFNGSKLEKLKGMELERVVRDEVNNYQNAGLIVGVPSVNENGAEKFDFQGIDRLVNSMLGLEWRIAIVCEPVSKQEVLTIRDDVYELYNRLSLYAKRTLQHSENAAKSISFGKTQSKSKGKNWGYNSGKSHSSGRQGERWNENNQTSEGKQEGQSRDETYGSNTGYNINKGSSNSITIEMANKHAEQLMKYIDDELLVRLKKGLSKGMFKTSIYYMAKKPTDFNKLKGNIVSLFQGDGSTYSPLQAYIIDLDINSNKNILRTYQNQYINDNRPYDELLLLSRPVLNGLIGLNTYMTGDEISLIAGLPQKEVPGIILKESISFGLNEKRINRNNAINLGCMVQKGRELSDMPFYLSKSSLNKHTFIAGVTGSGKTTTCHKLLLESNMPFLVIEPAKTEYRTLINSKKNLVVFTLGNENAAPFKINPFELIKGEIITSHIDMIKATFTSAFPMEASMPQLLEEAIIKCYEDKGWDLEANEHSEYGDDVFKTGFEHNCFPILSDLLNAMEQVVKTKHFSAQMQADYVGSLVSRLSNLTKGSKGSILNCQKSTDFKFIASNNVVIEMENMKSPEDKALLMGFILTRLSAVIKEEHKNNHNFMHLTLIEEAHRLLSKVEYGDSGSKKAAVETFSDMLAEIRKYGEGLIIVDQIPNKLAPEVLKNTNTKIIHKILARDDKEAVGDTMLMDDKQKNYLSSLEVGNAIIFSENTDSPVHVKIKAISDTSEKQIEDEIVTLRFSSVKQFLGDCYKEADLLKLYKDFNKVCSCIYKGNQISIKVYEKFSNKFKEYIKWSHSSISDELKKLIHRRISEQGIIVKDKNKYTSLLISFFIEFIDVEDYYNYSISEKIKFYMFK